MSSRDVRIVCPRPNALTPILHTRAHMATVQQDIKTEASLIQHKGGQGRRSKTDGVWM